MLKVERNRYSGGLDHVKITGFNAGELNELKSMEHHEAKEKLIEMLDSRNNREGTSLACGYGIYGLWFDNEAAYLSVGSTCD